MSRKNKTIEDMDKGDTKEIKNLLDGDLHCFKCGTVQTYLELLDNGDCCNCGVSLIGELF